MSKPLSQVHVAPEADGVVGVSYGQQSVKHFTKSNEIDFIGYMTDEECVAEIDRRAGAVASAPHSFWTAWRELATKDRIEEVVETCQKVLPLLDLPVHFFIFPWVAEAFDLHAFKGVQAVAPHKNVIHLYINPHAMQERGLMETIAHEFTHLYYYQNADTENYTLYEHIMMEGLAEIFREEVVGGEQAPWSVALTYEDASSIYANLTPMLDSRDVTLHQRVLFGDETYHAWTGYSIGYHLVKQERETHRALAWSAFIAHLRATKAVFRDIQKRAA